MKRKRRRKNRVKRAAIITLLVLIIATAIPVGVLASGAIIVSGDAHESKYKYSRSAGIDMDDEDGFITPRERLHERMVEKFDLDENGRTKDSSYETESDDEAADDEPVLEQSSYGETGTSDTKENDERILFADTFFIAHRGLNSLAPENTRSAFLEAGRAGFWGAECDVRETAHEPDGSFDLVICHNKTLSAMTGDPRKVSEVTADELRTMKVISGTNASELNETMCFLGSYLAVCDIYNMVPVIELKDKNMSDAAYEKIADDVEAAGLTGKAIYISYYGEVLSKMVETVETGYFHTPESHYLVNLKKGFDASEKSKKAAAYGFTGIGFDTRYVTADMIDAARENGLKLSLWGYDPSLVDRLRNDIKDYAVDYATTDGVLYDY